MTEEIPEIIDSNESDPTLERTQIIEKARESRRGILLEYLADIGALIDSHVPQPVKTIASVSANYLGFVGTVKMSMEAARGKTSDGKQLTPLGRLNHGIIQGLFLSAWYLGIQGEYWPSAMAYATSWAADGVQYYPEIISSIIELAQRTGNIKIIRKISKLKEVLDGSRVREMFFASTENNT